MSIRNIAVIVDDVELNREILSEMLAGEFDILQAENGREALDAVEQNADRVAVLLLDLMMPVMDGYQVLEELIRSGRIQKFPVLIISGETDFAAEEKCLSMGVTDFVKKPFSPDLVLKRVKNSVSLSTYRDHLEEKVAEQTAILREQADELKRNNRRLEEMNERIIELLANVVEARSMESGTHVKRVKGYSRILAEDIRDHYPEYGITDHMADSIYHASAMHDIGKIRIPDAVLLKPGRLTPEEFEIIKQHSKFGGEILDSCPDLWDKDYLDLCRQICLYHHEKWDGRGYPFGLAGDEIPIAAQLVSVADCYDALTTDRVYKKAFTSERAYEMIQGGECGMFNPKVMEAFRRCRGRFEELMGETQETVGEDGNEHNG